MEDEDTGEPLRDTTGGDGRFVFKDGPANRSRNGSTSSSRHALALDLSEVDGPYRDRYSASLVLPFGGSEGGGDSTNLTASVPLPFSKQNAQISGWLVDGSGDAVDNTDVVLTQRLPVWFEADGTPGDVLDLRVDTGTATDIQLPVGERRHSRLCPP